jgi:hypothetical protein
MENSTPPEPLLHQIFSAQLEISRQNEQAITHGGILGLADIDPITRDRLETSLPDAEKLDQHIVMRLRYATPPNRRQRLQLRKWSDRPSASNARHDTRQRPILMR